MEFTAQDIAPMSLGAQVLGGGGAGDPFIAELMLHELLRGGESITVTSVADLDGQDLVAPIALVGSPHMMSERLMGLDELRILFEGATLRDAPLVAVMPYEMAGLNAMLPLAAAAALGVPCLDADFTGHGVQSLNHSTLELDGVQPESYMLCDPEGRTVVLRKTGDLSVEDLIRPLVETMGWLAAITTSSMSADFCGSHALRGSLSRCLELGRLFEGLADLPGPQADPLLRQAGGALLGSGVIADRLFFADARGSRSSLAIDPDDATGPTLRVELRDEFHVVMQEGQVLATAPDILLVVDRVSWRPLSAEDVTPGRDVHVVAIRADDRWHSPDALALAGPRALGYGIDYVDFSANLPVDAR